MQKKYLWGGAVLGGLATMLAFPKLRRAIGGTTYRDQSVDSNAEATADPARGNPA
jgi:hypothetical protein